jgi:hypothetical protein
MNIGIGDDLGLVKRASKSALRLKIEMKNAWSVLNKFPHWLRRNIFQ